METLLIFFLLFTLLPQSILATPQPSSLEDRGAIRTIHQFPNETWIENIAVRANGNLLVTLIFEPEVWEIDPFSGKAALAHRFEDITSVFGIAEVGPDIFAVALGNWSYTDQVQPGTWSIWTMDVSSRPCDVHKVTDLPKAKYLEGMTAVPTAPGTILSADSTLGAIYRVDTSTGAYDTVISDVFLRPNKTAIVPLGVNGIHTYRDSSSKLWLYFTNTFARPFLGRMPISSSGLPTGPVQEIVPYAPGDVEADDFTLDCDGNAYVATNSANTLLKVTPDGKVSVAAGGAKQAVIAGVDAAKFGRTPQDKNILYLTTTGGIVVPPPSGIVGGKVVALDTLML